MRDHPDGPRRGRPQPADRRQREDRGHRPDGHHHGRPDRYDGSSEPGDLARRTRLPSGPQVGRRRRVDRRRSDRARRRRPGALCGGVRSEPRSVDGIWPTRPPHSATRRCLGRAEPRNGRVQRCWPQRATAKCSPTTLVRISGRRAAAADEPMGFTSGSALEVSPRGILAHSSAGWWWYDYANDRWEGLSAPALEADEMTLAALDDHTMVATEVDGSMLTSSVLDIDSWDMGGRSECAGTGRSSLDGVQQRPQRTARLLRRGVWERGG